VFLDEIGEMVPALQAKLLRVLEEKSFKRVGGAADIRVDVRVIAATNRNLEDQVAKGNFRSDLYYRLNVLPLRLPPLRDHAEDIPTLVSFFIDAFNTEFKKRVTGASPAASRLLSGYGWPGNVRELRNVVERAVYRHEDPERPIDQINFNPFHSPWAPAAIASAEGHSAAAEAQDEEAAPVAAASPLPVQAPVSTSDFRTAVAAYERQLLEEALQRNRFNQRATASALGLSYDQLRHALKRHKLQDSAA
jgi:psp operon transcriptional activator